MSAKNLRLVILIAGLVTGLIHTVVLNLSGFNPLMLLNGLGFLGLTWAVYTQPAWLSARRQWLMVGFMLYTAVTIIAYFILNETYGALGWITKADEVILLVALWLSRKY